MQAVGELIVEHMRLHSGAWPRSWKDLQNTCAVIGRGVFSTNADAEIEKLKKLIDVDWAADPEALRRVVIKATPSPSCGCAAAGEIGLSVPDRMRLSQNT
jgi:hypothetical protein